MTVRELIELLQTASPDAEVRLAYDSGCCYDDAKSVEINFEERGYIYISTEGPKEREEKESFRLEREEESNKQADANDEANRDLFATLDLGGMNYGRH